jgi:pyruvate,water dikinase
MIPWLHELRASDAASAGGKAANLGELIAAGVDVPPGFCLTVSAYRAALADALDRIAELAARLDPQMSEEALEDTSRAIRLAVEQAQLPDALRAELAEAYGQLRRDAPAVAVRSSAVAEDSAVASFAGQYTTELGVTTLGELLEAVTRCWTSLWSVRAIQYRWRRGVPSSEACMAVVVQAMVEPDASGVLFTVDPVTGGGDSIVIEASRGRGEAVVSGLVVPDRFVVSKRRLRIERSDLAAAGAAAGGAPPSLSAERAVALARIGRQIEAHFGGPQDVEWAVSADRCAILQTRPITSPAVDTATPRWHSPIAGARWARMSICDSWLPSPLSPLFATTLFPALIEGWLAGWAGTERGRTRSPLVPQPMSTTIHGYAYLRIDYPLNRHPLGAVRLIATWLRSYLGAPRRWRDDLQPRHVARLRELRRLALRAASTDQIVGLLAEAQALSGAYWGVIGGLAWHWNAAEWLLAKVHARVRPPGDGGDARGHGVLLQGFATKATQAELALCALARSSGDPPAAGPLAAFLDAYGHQVYDLDFVEPTPAEDPSALLAAMEAYRDGRAGDPGERLRRLAERRDAAVASVVASLRRSPVKRRLFRAALQWARRTDELRDQALFDFTQAWPLIRRGYLELGRRLAQAQVIDAAEDVFFVTGAEVVEALRRIDAGKPPDRHHEVVRERRVRWQDQKRLSPPQRIPEHSRVFLGPVDITNLAFVGRPAAPRPDAAMRGSAVSPGRVTAPARTICSVQEFGKLQKGDILIAPYITPAWTPLLAIAGGVVTDAGGALSHGSIVAREYGIPAVMGTHRATKLFRDGQIITIDGDRGVVY